MVNQTLRRRALLFQIIQCPAQRMAPFSKMFTGLNGNGSGQSSNNTWRLSVKVGDMIRLQSGTRRHWGLRTGVVVLMETKVQRLKKAVSSKGRGNRLKNWIHCIRYKKKKPYNKSPQKKLCIQHLTAFVC